MSDSKTLRVFNLNAWGFRLVSSGLKEKKARFEALRNVLACNEYDVALLQELWYRADYDLLKALFPHSSYLSDHYNNATGNIAPLGCSGLVILSKFPLEEVEFLPFERRGGLITFDGEILVQKGVGRARIHLPMNGHTSLKVDLFTTHLVAYVGTKFRDWINDKLRYKQALELHQMIKNSDADIKILSGDFNTPPKVGNQEPYGLLASVMTDSLIDKFPNASLDPDFATIDTKSNTYSTDVDNPKRIDYLMHWASPQVAMSTRQFAVQSYKTQNHEGKTISISDHEALTAEYLIELVP